jgi:hypothetical protein
MHMTVIWNVVSTCVLPIYGQSMIIWHMANLPVGVFTVDWIVQYVWMALMHLGCSTTRKPLSLIVIKDYFHQITHLGMTHGRFWKAKPLERGYQSKNLGQIS